jgi:hypothetical protein
MSPKPFIPDSVLVLADFQICNEVQEHPKLLLVAVGEIVGTLDRKWYKLASIGLKPECPSKPRHY